MIYVVGEPNRGSTLPLIRTLYRRCPRGVMVKAMECRIVVSEFELQSRYNVHFRKNILKKGMNPLIPLAIV